MGFVQRATEGREGLPPKQKQALKREQQAKGCGVQRGGVLGTTQNEWWRVIGTARMRQDRKKNIAQGRSTKSEQGSGNHFRTQRLPGRRSMRNSLMGGLEDAGQGVGDA